MLRLHQAKVPYIEIKCSSVSASSRDARLYYVHRGSARSRRASMQKVVYCTIKVCERLCFEQRRSHTLHKASWLVASATSQDVLCKVYERLCFVQRRSLILCASRLGKVAPSLDAERYYRVYERLCFEQRRSHTLHKASWLVASATSQDVLWNVCERLCFVQF